MSAAFAISKRSVCKLAERSWRAQQPFTTPIIEQLSAVQQTPLAQAPGLQTTPQSAPLQTTRVGQLIGPVHARCRLRFVADPIELGQLLAPAQLRLHWFVCAPQLMRDWQESSPEQVTSHWAAVHSVSFGHALGPEQVNEQREPAQFTPPAQLLLPSQVMSQLSASVQRTPFGQACSP
jgi:hypothetical protein